MTGHRGDGFVEYPEALCQLLVRRGQRQQDLRHLVLSPAVSSSRPAW
ncbi:hypothetical protein AB0O61_24330 [Streptomyces bungoensis]